MKRLISRHEFRGWLAFFLLAVAVVIIFHAVSQLDVFVAWIARFVWIIAPFLWGFLLAYILNIPREKLEGVIEKSKAPWALKHKRGLSVLAVYLILITAGSLLSILVFPRVIETVADLFNFLPTLFDEIHGFLYRLSNDDSFPFDFSDLLYGLTFDEVLAFIDFEYVGLLFDGAVAFLSFLFRFVLAIITSVYFMAEGKKIRKVTKRIFKAILPQKAYRPLVKYGREINLYFKRYIYCQVLDAIILGTIMTLLLSLLQVQYALALGPMLGFANLIPFFGAIIGTIVAVIVIFVTDGTTMGFVAGIIMVVIQQIDANYIFPRLIGGSMKISPILVIIGITVGNAYFGIVGMIVAIPIVTVARNIIDEILLHIEAKKETRRNIHEEEV